MKCPKCQSENPEGAKFCVECGTKIEIICPKCGFINSPSFKFCSECGQNLILKSEPISKILSPEEKIEKIKDKYPNKNYYYICDTQGDIIEGNQAKIKTIAVTWGWHSKKKLRKVKPDYFVDSPNDLTNFL